MSHTVIPGSQTIFVDIGIKVIVERMSKSVAEETSIQSTKLVKTGKWTEESQNTQEYSKKTAKYSVEKMNRSSIEESGLEIYNKKGIEYKAGTR